MDAAHDLEALAKRCEAAAGPDRELDAEIAATAGLRVVDEGHPLGRCCYDRNGISIVLPRYTASLDAAMTLVPEGMWGTLEFGKRSRCKLGRFGELKPLPNEAFAYTAAQALAAASLRARSQGVNDDHA
jgi:hypothetical protein